ncbi:hypothetical protein CSUI_007251 [Cystoisospora suis]|uniref:Uncharacterized protein n=1 Tax=Cystoisospora suis TaxID=483139 RepID=A0A2C6JW11_9APIC|nr:hypothetical protein CSUI_007251 [Cystoisospora suis]
MGDPGSRVRTVESLGRLQSNSGGIGLSRGSASGRRFQLNLVEFGVHVVGVQQLRVSASSGTQVLFRSRLGSNFKSTRRRIFCPVLAFGCLRAVACWIAVTVVVHPGACWGCPARGYAGD